MSITNRLFWDEESKGYQAAHRALLAAKPLAWGVWRLKPGGLFAFCMSTPVRDMCTDPANGLVSSALTTGYFGMRAIDDGGAVNYQLPYGAWIRLFRQHSLVVEDLVELQAPAHGTTSYEDFVPLEWARRWPAEHVWKLRKAD
jgi:hypothetical protein